MRPVRRRRRAAPHSCAGSSRHFTASSSTCRPGDAGGSARWARRRRLTASFHPRSMRVQNVRYATPGGTFGGNDEASLPAGGTGRSPGVCEGASSRARGVLSSAGTVSTTRTTRAPRLSAGESALGLERDVGPVRVRRPSACRISTPRAAATVRLNALGDASTSSASRHQCSQRASPSQPAVTVRRRRGSGSRSAEARQPGSCGRGGVQLRDRQWIPDTISSGGRRPARWQAAAASASTVAATRQPPTTSRKADCGACGSALARDALCRRRAPRVDRRRRPARPRAGLPEQVCVHRPNPSVRRRPSRSGRIVAGYRLATLIPVGAAATVRDRCHVAGRAGRGRAPVGRSVDSVNGARCCRNIPLIVVRRRTPPLCRYPHVESRPTAMPTAKPECVRRSRDRVHRPASITRRFASTLDLRGGALKGLETTVRAVAAECRQHLRSSTRSAGDCSILARAVTSRRGSRRPIVDAVMREALRAGVPRERRPLIADTLNDLRWHFLPDDQLVTRSAAGGAAAAAGERVVGIVTMTTGSRRVRRIRSRAARGDRRAGRGCDRDAPHHEEVLRERARLAAVIASAGTPSSRAMPTTGSCASIRRPSACLALGPDAGNGSDGGRGSRAGALYAATPPISASSLAVRRARV